jgi:uncharacterized membrane protein YuzA (DUF378 family)
MKPNSFVVWQNIISLFLVALGALNWGLVAWFRFNLVEWLESKTVQGLAVVVYSIIAVSALIHILSRDYYLRFLGDAAFPCGALVERVPDKATVQIPIKVEPNVNVIYWASEPAMDKDATPWIAYQKYANSGVARSDSTGNALLKVRNPSAYTTPLNKTLQPHVHYRVCKSDGMASRVETVFLSPHASSG